MDQFSNVNCITVLFDSFWAYDSHAAALNHKLRIRETKYIDYEIQNLFRSLLPRDKRNLMIAVNIMNPEYTLKNKVESSKGM